MEAICCCLPRCCRRQKVSDECSTAFSRNGSKPPGSSGRSLAHDEEPSTATTATAASEMPVRPSPLHTTWLPSSVVAQEAPPLPSKKSSASASRCTSACSLNSASSSVRRIRTASRPNYYSASTDGSLQGGGGGATTPRTGRESVSSLSSSHSVFVSGMRRELLGFGLAADGQLAIRTLADSNCVRIPEHIIGAPHSESGASVRQISCGEKHSLILAEDGKMWSVGNNDHGQLGRGRPGPGSFTIYPVEFSASSKVIQVACGRAHSTCITEDGRLFSWGLNGSGQLGLPCNEAHVEKPRRVSSITEVVQVACGPEHTIALTENGRVYVCGLQYDGACLHTPTEITQFIGVPIVRVAAGGRHWVAISASGSVFTWGQNDYGQLGTGDTTRRGTPVRLDNVSQMRVVEAACGDAHTVLLTRDGRLFTFGSDSFGQLGCGRRTDVQTMPNVVGDLMGSQVTRIAAGRCHTSAVVKGRLYTFGLNTSGQLGNGSVRNQLTPRHLDDMDHVAAVFSGWDQTFVVRAAGVPDVLSGPNCDHRLPHFLSKARIMDHLQKKEKLDLIGDLESVFSSLSSINGSFLFDDERRFSVSEKNHGVSLDEVMDAFNTLAQSSDAKQYADLVIETCQLSFFSADFDPKTFLSDECLRPFLVLPWLNAFMLAPDQQTVEAVHLPFCLAFAQLKVHQMKTLERWWSAMPVRHFNRIVTALVTGVNRLVLSEACPSKSTPLLQVLSRLNGINRLGNKIPLDNFYVNDLGEKIDVKMDYLKWATRDKNSHQFFWSNYPFILNGVAKGELLHVEAQLQQQQMVNNSAINFLGFNLFLEQPCFVITVRRDHLVSDTVNALLSAEPKSLHKPLRVEFHGEEAEDGGGVRKEFFMLLFQQILQPEYGMFNEDSDSHLVWFSGAENDASSFQMVGALCGLAVYNRVLVAFPFPSALYKLILNQSIGLEDFCELRPVEGRSLRSLLDYEGEDFEDTFSLDFSITHTVFGHPTEVELKTHGKDLSVNQQNKQEYVQLYVKSRMEEGLNGEIRKQINYFKEGFMAVINSRIINFFQPRELMELVIGNENYDWTEFKKVVEYKGEFYARHPAILAFWDAFFELSLEERKKFLQFLMGTTRLPVQGMKAVKVTIQPTAEHTLPVAHTCFNLLDLPNISDKKEMLRRLRISIEHTSGFTLV